MARRPSLTIREKRLGAVSAYFGEIGPLLAELEAGEPSQRVRTFSQAAPDDIVQALRFLGGIEGAGIVLHGARGCAGALPLAALHNRWAVSNLDQRDSILGSDKALSETVRTLYRRHRPWVVFVVATPVVAINNDEIRFTAEELSEDLGIPVIVVQCDGFRSRIASTGFDAATQAALPLFKSEDGRQRNDLINLLAIDRGSGLAHIGGLLRGLGLSVNLLPAGAGEAAFRQAAAAALTITVQPDELDSLGRGLEQRHDVPFLHLPPPIGFTATGRFLTGVAEAFGVATSAFELSPEKSLAGKRVVLALPPASAFATAELVAELGGAVVGTSVEHIDTGHVDALKFLAAKWPELPLHVAAGQPFEQANLLARLSPDLLIGSVEHAVLAARMGIPAVPARPADLLGWEGAAWLARQAGKALANGILVTRLAAGPSPYRSAWFKRSPDWHIKLEVK